MVRLKDVAKIAGVTPSIVSRLINNDPSLSIRPETEEKILKAIEETGYVVSKKRKKKNCNDSNNYIGFLIPDFYNPVFASIVKGAHDRAFKYGYNIVVCETEDQTQMNKNQLHMLREKNIDALIYASANMSMDLIEELNDFPAPCILVNRSHPYSNHSFIGTDNVAGASMAMNHLFSLGHTRIAHLSGPLYLDTAIERMHGYRKSLKDNNISFRSEYCIETKYTMEGGIKGAKKLLDLPEPPTAIFAANDMIALGVIEGLSRQNIKVPDDISVMGFNNISFSEMASVPISTISFDYAEIGAKAVDHLYRSIKNRDSSKTIQQLLEPKLIVRESTSHIS